MSEMRRRLNRRGFPRGGLRANLPDMTRTALPILLFLAACAPWPDVGGPTRGGGSEWPTLLPLDDVIAGGTVPAASEGDANRLAARAAALRNRAAVLRSDASDMEALRARLAR